jgi:hypothetical protein
MAKKDPRLKKSINFIKGKLLISCVVVLLIAVGYLLGRGNSLFLGTSGSQKPTPTVKVATPTLSSTPTPTPTPKVIYIQPAAPTPNPALTARLNDINSQLTDLQNRINNLRGIYNTANTNYNSQCDGTGGENIAACTSYVSEETSIIGSINNLKSQIEQLNTEKTQILLKQ